MSMNGFRPVRAAAMLLCIGAVPAWAGESAQPEQPALKIDWTRGPTDLGLGSIAQTKLPEHTLFAGPDDTRKLMKRMGNVPNGLELGLVVPSAEGQDWFVVFEHHSVGFVKDDDKDKIDADAILRNIREATEEANKERAKDGASAMHVVGWQEAPHYDSKTHHLEWAILGRDDRGHEVVNYDIRILGRDGYVSATLVETPAGFAAAKPRLDELVSTFSYKTGKKYSEWVKGDKVAEYGLTALVAAGAGAAAVKLGLFAVLGKMLAKLWKLIAVAFVAIGGAAARLWNAIRRRLGMDAPPPGPSATT